MVKLSPLNKVREIDIKHHIDDRGALSYIEDIELPFVIKRVYFFNSSVKSIVRGEHAHLKLKQLFVCVDGSCDILLKDGYGNEKLFNATANNKGILIEPLLWRELTNFSKNCTFLVLASDYYKKDDYIYDYDIFKNYVNNIKSL